MEKNKVKKNGKVKGNNNNYVIAKYDKDSKRFHRYLIESEDIVGTIYFSKKAKIPAEVIIRVEK